MNEKLTVKNFGPIKDAELELKKVTIFIGPQGSGKSTLAKLVAICKDNPMPFGLLNEINRSELQAFDDFKLKSFLRKKPYVLFVSNDYTISFDNNRFSKKYSALFKEIILRTKTLMNKVSNDTNFAESRIFSKQYTLMLSDFRKVGMQKVLYVPTERFLISTISESLFSFINNKVTIPKFILEFGEHFITARDKIGLFNISYLDINYRFKNGRDVISNTKLDYEIELASSASGIQAIIPLKLVVEYNALFDDEYNKYFIVEEPELNLFPTTQKQLIGYLSDRCTKGNNELLMTTHSPYVLSAINNLIFAFQVAQALPERADDIAQIIPKEQWLNPDDVAAYYVGEDENGEKGGVHSIFNRKTGLIGQNELDEISEELGDEFDALMNIYRTRKRETVN